MENFDFINSVVFPYANLLVFLVLAYMILRKPILNGLAAKRQGYLALMERSNKARHEAESKQRELEAKLRDLDRELNQMKSDIKAQAEAEAKQILEGANHLAEHLKREARRIAEAEITAAKQAIQGEILQQVKQRTAEEIQKSLDEGRHRQVVQKGLADLGQAKEVLQ